VNYGHVTRGCHAHGIFGRAARPVSSLPLAEIKSITPRYPKKNISVIGLMFYFRIPPCLLCAINLRQETRQMCRCLEKEAEVGLGEGSHFSLVVRAWVPAFPLDFHLHAGLYSLAYRSTPHGRCARCTLSYPRHSPARPAHSHVSG
jgi:hypothetical protein